MSFYYFQVNSNLNDQVIVESCILFVALINFSPLQIMNTHLDSVLQTFIHLFKHYTYLEQNSTRFDYYQLLVFFSFINTLFFFEQKCLRMVSLGVALNGVFVSSSMSAMDSFQLNLYKISAKRITISSIRSLFVYVKMLLY